MTDGLQESDTVSADPSEEILFAVAGQVATITFNRPQAMNAMTWNMYDRLVAYCDELDGNDAIRVAILRGAGDRAFVSGTDISQFQAFATPRDAIDYERRTGEVIDRLERVRKPIIAMIHGVCVGGGASIALACDFRYADPALRFGIPIARTLGNCLSLKRLQPPGRLRRSRQGQRADHASQAPHRGRGAEPRRGDRDRAGRPARSARCRGRRAPDAGWHR